jgi:hypothetical protein
MSDKDKHNPKQEKDVKITFTPSGEKTVPFATKKPAEVVNAQLEKETSNNSLDINSNLGTFAEPNATEQTVPGAQTKSNVEIVKDLEHDDKTIDDTLTPQKHNKDQVIDFDKFSRVKPSRFNNRLAIKMDI